VSVNYTSEEMMTVAAARQFKDRTMCFVGVGLPSVAACLARRVCAPDIVLMYESGAIGAQPVVPPLSIADPELAETAITLVSVPEMFAYWLQGGRVELGVLGAAQIDRFANLNTTVIGDYHSSKLRLPGAGGAPHVAATAREVLVIVRHNLKTFVPSLDFLTTTRATGRTTVVTDLGILETDSATGELRLAAHYPGTNVDHIREVTGWPLRIADALYEAPPPAPDELDTLRQLLS
jgi:glutaconate CoA-transferase subunit B